MPLQIERRLRPTVSVTEPGRTFSTGHRAQLSSTKSAPGYSYHTHRTPVLTIADITAIPAGQGLYCSPRGWKLITLNPWWQQAPTLFLFTPIAATATSHQPRTRLTFSNKLVPQGFSAMCH
jgi:hypothetical protein